MAIEWVKGILIPLIEIVFIGGFILFIVYIFYKTFHKVWSRSTKFVIKYNILRRKIPETTISWVINCIEKGIGYYDAKKFLITHNVEWKKVNETMWVYDKIINQLNRDHAKSQKGGMKNNGREFKGRNSKIETTTGTELPDI